MKARELVLSRGVTNMAPLPKERARRRVARHFIIDKSDLVSKSNSKGYNGNGYWIEILKPNSDGYGYRDKRVCHHRHSLKLHAWNSRNGAKPRAGILQVKVFDQKENDDHFKNLKRRYGWKGVFYLGSVRENGEKYYAYAVFHETSPN